MRDEEMSDSCRLWPDSVGTQSPADRGLHFFYARNSLHASFFFCLYVRSPAPGHKIIR